MVSVSVLRSSSSGNSTLIWNKKHAILVDCGLGPRVTEELLGSLGFSMGDLSGVLVTHAHRDHSNATTIEKLFHHKIPIYCTPSVKTVVLRDLLNKKKHQFRTFSSDPFAIESFKITSFRVSHDSEGGCVGFCIFSGDGEKTRKISLVTDYGQPDSLIAQSILDSHLILIASNYDLKMMEHSSVVPRRIKQRHIIPYHPSNDECANVLLSVAKSSAILPKAVYLLHISKNHNTVDTAVSQSQRMLHAAGCSQIRILPTYGDAMSETMHLK
jgi:phosphoribosyl 1,2-cyclic phosphodiesterase